MGVPENIIVLPYVRTYVSTYVRTYVRSAFLCRATRSSLLPRSLRPCVRTYSNVSLLRACPPWRVRTHVRTYSNVRTYVRTYVRIFLACVLSPAHSPRVYVRTYVRTYVRALFAPPFARVRHHSPPSHRAYARTHVHTRFGPLAPPKGKGKCIRTSWNVTYAYVATVYVRTWPRWLEHLRATCAVRARPRGPEQLRATYAVRTLSAAPPPPRRCGTSRPRTHTAGRGSRPTEGMATWRRPPGGQCT